MRLKQTICAIAIFTVCATLSPMNSDAADESENIIKFRKNVMKGIGAHISNIAAVVKGEVSIMENLLTDAQAISMGLRHVGILFPEGTDIGKTNALPSVWDNPSDFQQALSNTQSAAQNMVLAAESNDVNKIGAALGSLGKACKDCHKDYKKKK